MFSFSEEDLSGVGSIRGQRSIKTIKPITTNPIKLPIQSINEYFSFSLELHGGLEIHIVSLGYSDL